jgi:hypothetical protein
VLGTLMHRMEDARRHRGGTRFVPQEVW